MGSRAAAQSGRGCLGAVAARAGVAHWSPHEPRPGTTAASGDGDVVADLWTTDSAWANTCRTLTVTLTDGTAHTANFQLH
ncbi:PxKF domain-containing protein [Amycolatopsis sp. NPDC059021]|uniref:PxKF domain-containing protein n=1 Tax=Amycolatopsis sp. NPDC059021 TaxID=3346704 RepID=UPI00366F1275